MKQKKLRMLRLPTKRNLTKLLMMQIMQRKPQKKLTQLKRLMRRRTNGQISTITKSAMMKEASNMTSQRKQTLIHLSRYLN